MNRYYNSIQQARDLIAEGLDIMNSIENVQGVNKGELREMEGQPPNTIHKGFPGIHKGFPETRKGFPEIHKDFSRNSQENSNPQRNQDNKGILEDPKRNQELLKYLHTIDNYVSLSEDMKIVRPWFHLKGFLLQCIEGGG